MRSIDRLNLPRTVTAGLRRRPAVPARPRLPRWPGERGPGGPRRFWERNRADVRQGFAALLTSSAGDHLGATARPADHGAGSDRDAR
jgi:hypothetical protein